MIQKIYGKDIAEMQKYDLLSRYTLAIPQIFHSDFDKKIILMEDLNQDYIQGNCFNDNNKMEDSSFWEKGEVFEHLELD